MPVKAWMCLAGSLKKLSVVEVCRRRVPPIQGDFGLAGQGRQQQGLDAGITGPGGEQHNRAPIVVLPGAGAYGTFELYRIAHLQGRQDAFGKQATADLANMKHQPALVLRGQIGHGETAAVAIVEAKPEVLAGPDFEWLGSQQHQLDDVGAQRAFADHLCAGFQRGRVQ